ncbi:Inactive peptidyl-prolyl cis-trans isomerase fkbp6, partial [Halocaridina rubra]
DGSLQKGNVFEIACEEVETEQLCDDAEALNSEAAFDNLCFGASSKTLDDDDNSSSDSSSAPFEKLARHMEDISGDGGVFKKLVWPGSGGDIPKSATITFHYNAFLEDTDEPFDSTYLRNKPEKKRLDECLPGLAIALETMRIGETSRFLVKPRYAYGEIGCPPRIPGNETIFFHISVVNFLDAALADAFDNLEGEKQQGATFPEKLEAARGFHRKGNDLVKEGNLLAAKNSYLRAAWIMEDARLQNEEEEIERGLVLLKVRSNLAQVYLDLHDPGKACNQCKLGISVRGVQCDEILAKLYYRFGKAKTLLSKYDEALKEFQKAQRLKPNNADIKKALKTLLIKKATYEEQEKFFMKKMFNFKQSKLNDDSSENTRCKDLNMRPEFKKMVEEQITQFVADPDRQELSFPSNLSRSAVDCVSTLAKAADLRVKVMQRWMEYHVKLTKKN